MACSGIAVVATAIGTVLPVLSPPLCGIVIGVAVAATLVRDPDSALARRLRPGIAVASRHLLQLAVVLLGSQLSLTEVARTGLRSLPVMLGTLAACLAGASVIGRRLRVGADLRTLIGVGAGICGASAIAAVTPVLEAAEADVAYAISTIFLFNIAAVLTFPLLGHALRLSQGSFGLFAGTAVNDTSSVVAAASAYGAEATRQAVVVKLTRTLLIIPISFGLAARQGRQASQADQASRADQAHQADQASQAKSGLTRLVPWFLAGFLLASAARTIGLIPVRARGPLDDLAVFGITVALSAIGLSTDLRGLRRAGPRPLLLGACLWLLVSATSLILQAIFGMT